MKTHPIDRYESKILLSSMLQAYAEGRKEDADSLAMIFDNPGEFRNLLAGSQTKPRALPTTVLRVSPFRNRKLS